MNPIIFIDELDKISRTENGKEIIGILTHLIDPTQNDKFQDKYFNGIDLDLSKALFIFSYNDVNLIDKILLDRIHRIKFDFLTLKEKIEIVKKFMLPEIFTKMGLENIIDINDEVVEYIIDTYTNEPGVRKLKELLFEIMGEININILKKTEIYDIPITITKEDVKEKYLKSHNYVIVRKIHNNDKVGLINGMWANSAGCGGILPIEVSRFLSTNLMEFKLTGMQGDVMKESMNVARSLAYDLVNQFNKDISFNNQAIHVHCPDGSTPKDGPSAGTAITLVIYSLLTNKKIKNDIAITGEINLFGNISQIGGLEFKVMGALKADVKTIIYPTDNQEDINKIIIKYPITKNLNFISASNIREILNIVFGD
jgi:ATP-dependent Lon protease